MFAYCNNNPVNFSDLGGDYPTYSGVLYSGERFFNVPSHYLGYLGQIKEYWEDADTIDITDKLDATMKKNAAEMQSYSANHNIISTGLYFAERVKPGGTWDFKSQDDWNLEYNVTYLYNDTKLMYDDIGNIHYGYVGHSVFSMNTLLTMAGIVQIGTLTSDFSYINTNFDDPRDQWAVAYGSILWDVEG